MKDLDAMLKDAPTLTLDTTSTVENKILRIK